VSAADSSGEHEAIVLVFVEIDSPAGPRAVVHGEADISEIEAALPAGWLLSKTPAVRISTGRWSYPLVQAQEAPCKPSFAASRSEAVAHLQVELDRVFGLHERVKVVARVPLSHLWVELDRGVCSEPLRTHTDTTMRVLRLFRDGAGADEGRQIVFDAIRPPREVAASTEEIEAALPEGWALSETPAVRNATGGWSYPPVRTSPEEESGLDALRSHDLAEVLPPKVAEPERLAKTFATGDVVFDVDRPGELGIVREVDTRSCTVAWAHGGTSGGPGLLLVLRHCEPRLRLEVPRGAHATRGWSREQAVRAALRRAGLGEGTRHMRGHATPARRN